MSLAPQAQRRLLGIRLELVPLIERAAPRQQSLEAGVGAPPAEKLPDLVKIAGQKFVNEVERERFAEVEIPLVGYPQKFLGIVDVIGQGIKVVGELGMADDLARLLAKKSLMLAVARSGDKLEGFQQVLEADRHRDAPGMVRRLNASIFGNISGGGDIH